MPVAGSLSLEEAEAFLLESQRLEKGLHIKDELLFLFVSLNEEISKPISGGERSEHNMTPMLIDSMVSLLHPNDVLFL